ncbi:MAG: hypothetical protein M1840_008665 [Geoglossum simile]|nr:MAG: hypothetical protein M1840_008665 [Geoglossum simile]
MSAQCLATRRAEPKRSSWPSNLKMTTQLSRGKGQGDQSPSPTGLSHVFVPVVKLRVVNIVERFGCRCVECSMLLSGATLSTKKRAAASIAQETSVRNLRVEKLPPNPPTHTDPPTKPLSREERLRPLTVYEVPPYRTYTKEEIRINRRKTNLRLFGQPKAPPRDNPAYQVDIELYHDLTEDGSGFPFGDSDEDN